MIKPDVSQLFHLIGNVKYVIFLVMGSCFIFQGNVIQKFESKKTSFTEVVESLSELPTILITIIYKENRNLSYGNDISITFGKMHSAIKYNLSYGMNDMDDPSIPSLRFEPYSARDLGAVGTIAGFLIVPMSLPGRSILIENPGFELTLSVKNTSDFLSKVVSIGMALSTENNSIPCITSENKCVDPPYKDGSVTTFLISPGQVGLCYIYPKKYVYLEESNECRTHPYNQEVLHLSLKKMLLVQVHMLKK